MLVSSSRSHRLLLDFEPIVAFFPFLSIEKPCLICVYANDNDLWEMAALLNPKIQADTVLTA